MFDEDDSEDVEITIYASEEEKKAYRYFLKVDNYIKVLEDFSDEEIMDRRDEFRKTASQQELYLRIMYQHLDINETVVELILLDLRKYLSAELFFISRYGEWFGVRFKQETSISDSENFNKIMENLKTKPTPEESVEYFDTMGIDVEIIPNKYKMLE